MSDPDCSSSVSLSTPPPPPFLEVSTSDGKLRRRFAAGTKARFAIDRINRTSADNASNQYSFIESFKEGEEVVEFGPDAELVSYGNGWKLRAVQEDVNFPKSAPFPVISKVEAKDEIKATETVRKEFNPADFYPGGVLPEGPLGPGNTSKYVLNVFLVFGFAVLLVGVWVFVLESQFFAMS